MNEELLKRAIKIYGASAQIDMVTEESAELIQAINKLKRRGGVSFEGIIKPNEGTDKKYAEIYTNLCGEVADVKIMLAQLEIMLSKDLISLEVDKKMKRLEKRLDKKPISRRLRFYKEVDGSWFVDLPEWTGSKSELQMVSGADTMLDFMSEDKGEVSVYISDGDFEGGDVLVFNRFAHEIGNGAHYKLPKFKGVDINLDVWLCDVTAFVFGFFPKSIYISSNV